MKKTVKITLMATFVMVAMSFGTLSAKPAKITVNGNCNMCKAKIEKAAKDVKGVTTAVWDRETKVLTVDFDEKITDVKAIEKAVANIGFDAGEEKANVEARKKLPACCTSNKTSNDAGCSKADNHKKDAGCSKADNHKKDAGCSKSDKHKEGGCSKADNHKKDAGCSKSDKHKEGGCSKTDNHKKDAGCSKSDKHKEGGCSK